jgi:hypothetical protein
MTAIQHRNVTRYVPELRRLVPAYLTAVQHKQPAVGFFIIPVVAGISEPVKCDLKDVAGTVHRGVPP